MTGWAGPAGGAALAGRGSGRPLQRSAAAGNSLLPLPLPPGPAPAPPTRAESELAAGAGPAGEAAPWRPGVQLPGDPPAGEEPGRPGPFLRASPHGHRAAGGAACRATGCVAALPPTAMRLPRFQPANRGTGAQRDLRAPRGRGRGMSPSPRPSAGGASWAVASDAGNRDPQVPAPRAGLQRDPSVTPRVAAGFRGDTGGSPGAQAHGPWGGQKPTSTQSPLARASHMAKELCPARWAGPAGGGGVSDLLHCPQSRLLSASLTRSAGRWAGSAGAVSHDYLSLKDSIL